MKTGIINKQPWIYAALPDSLFILAPVFLVVFVVMLFPGIFRDGADISSSAWILLVLCVDVAHVYSTLYRTYFDREIFQERKTLFLIVPLLVFIAGVLLYSVSDLLFWRIAAYFAVFHFVRQQYGFLRIYSRKENQPAWARWFDSVMIYTLTLYPILWWHLNGPRGFSWFIPDDFCFFRLPWLVLPVKIIYWLIVSGWLVKEISFCLKTKQMNVPKFFLVAGTGISWYIGIISYNGDLVFTALNVISHGIPYMALIWMHGNKKMQKESMLSGFTSRIFKLKNLPFFIGILLIAGYIEEGFWDSIVWKDHPEFFGIFNFIPVVPDFYLAFLVPLLAVPQLTHYVLDGFIWKIRKDNFNWKDLTLEK